MATQLLLTEDVVDLGRKGDIVSVKPGFARNFLLPKGFAVAASPRALRMQARLKEERQQKALADKSEAEAIAAKLVDVSLSTTVKVDQEGHMYGSVSAADIVHLIKAATEIELERSVVQLKHAIKTTGEHTIALKLKEGVESSVALNIIAEGSK
jgi:large subunit ribosomal protein L9